MELVNSSVEVVPLVLEPEVISKYSIVEGRKLKFCKGCKSYRDLETEFHGQKVKKSLCKPCTLEEIYDKRQIVLAERFAFGDLLVSLCGCKNYFINTIPKKDDRTELRERCKACANGETKNLKHFRVSYKAQMEAKDKIIEELNAKVSAMEIELKLLKKEKKAWQKK